MPHYDFLFPDGHRSTARIDQPIEVGGAVSWRRELFRIQRVSRRGRSGPAGDVIPVELEPWPARAPVLGRVHDVSS